MVRQDDRPRNRPHYNAIRRCTPAPPHPLPNPQAARHARSLPTPRHCPAPPALTQSLVEHAPQHLAAPSTTHRSSPRPPARALLPCIPLPATCCVRPYPQAHPSLPARCTRPPPSAGPSAPPTRSSLVIRAAIGIYVSRRTCRYAAHANVPSQSPTRPLRARTPAS